MNSGNDLIDKLNEVLQSKTDCTVNIVNDKLTLGVFSLLKDNLKNVKEINFIIRDIRYLPENKEVAREFEMDTNPRDFLFNNYDIIEKNKLKHYATAKSMYDFICQHVNVKITKPPHAIRGNLLIVDNDFMIQGSSSLEMSNKATRQSAQTINFDTVIYDRMDGAQIQNAKNTFERIWYGNDITLDFKEELLRTLAYVYKDHCPEFLYYFTLNEVFGTQLDYGVERFEKDNIRFKQTDIWNALFEFQKDAVLSAIQKINKYNGCIIADSVGLGKTFEALAVIKYFELRQDNILVLTPVKLYENWDSFKNPYKDNEINDIFNYKILCHTDLSRYNGMSKSGIDLSRIDWSCFDLIVIDESHNFRNRTEKDDGFTRYQRLLTEVVQKSKNTKVLLLSATPVNNSLTDLRNQISLITGDRDNFFAEHGIDSISNALRNTQIMMNAWYKNDFRDKKNLFDTLPSQFYKLLEMITISRSRKHITTYYSKDRLGKFPEKLKPETFNPDIDINSELLNFETTNEILESLNLCIYSPMKYIKSEFQTYYSKKFETVYSGKVLFKHENREMITATLHRFNLFKRLESSIYSFGETIARLLNKIDRTIELLEKNENADTVEFIDDNLEEDETLDYKYEISVKHLKKADYLEDLYYDKSILDNLNKDIRILLDHDRDMKLYILRDFLCDKVNKTPYNEGNKKVLIFSAFADTANYLYERLKDELLGYGVHTAVVSGSYPPKSNNPTVKNVFNEVLRKFSPLSKSGHALSNAEGIDILIGTDCISEGQNLQDCDCVINYDIQWNPVSLIQRFGRIDRIGSINEKIQMVNFFPNVALNEYLNLEQRVKGKMNLVAITSTGDSDTNILSPEMADMSFRKKQLEKLKDTVIDIDEANDSISLTDLNLNDYLYELSEYIKKNPDIKKVPKGVYSITDGEKNGVVFCFKHKNVLTKPKSDSSLYPYYLVYVSNDGEIIYSNLQAREVLKEYRRLCQGKDEPLEDLNNKFLKKTNNVKDMSFYSKLLTKSVSSMQGDEESQAQGTIFDFGGFDNPFASETSDDFELISFLVVD